MCIHPLPATPRAERILVIRLGAVGDVVRTLVAVSALRAAFPHASIAWLVEPPSKSLLEAQPWIDRILVFPRDRIRDALLRGRLVVAAREIAAMRRSLREACFDLVLDFHSILKSGILSAATGSRERIGFSRPFGREGAWLFATRRAALVRSRISRFDRNDGLLEFLRVAPRPDPAPLRVPESSLETMRRVLADGPRPIAVHPGTSPSTPHKRWPAAHFATVIRALHRERGIPSVLTSGPDPRERALADEIVARADGAARHAPQTRSLGDLAALFAACRLYLGGDTGPLHVASLVGTPVVQILGPTDPVENAPWRGVPSRVVRAGLPCSPCRRGCASAACMAAVSPEAVLAAMLDLLDRTPVAAAPRPS
ncbi:heptosyltransferase I [Myxococcaceae bacterium]|nr:heptosyltransferase I [Myxococcaceae bacterium]